MKMYGLRMFAGKVAEVAGGVVAHQHYLYGNGPGLYDCQRELWPSGAWFGSPAGRLVYQKLASGLCGCCSTVLA